MTFDKNRVYFFQEDNKIKKINDYIYVFFFLSKPYDSIYVYFKKSERLFLKHSPKGEHDIYKLGKI